MKTTTFDLPAAIRELLDAEGATDILETILTDAATTAVETRVAASYRAIYKGKINGLKFDEPRPYTMDELNEATAFLISPEDTVRAFSDRDNVEGRAPTSNWSDPANSGHDTRDVVSDDNMNVILEDSERLLKAVTIESVLADAGINSTKTSAECLDGWNNWRRDRLARNKTEDAVARKERSEKSKAARKEMAGVLSKLA